MRSYCGCLCEHAGHFDICQQAVQSERRQIIQGLTITPDSVVCQACFDAVLALAKDRHDEQGARTTS